MRKVRKFIKRLICFSFGHKWRAIWERDNELEPGAFVCLRCLNVHFTEEHHANLAECSDEDWRSWIKQRTPDDETMPD